MIKPIGGKGTKMLYNELDVMEYAVTMETEMLEDDYLIDWIMSEIEQEKEEIDTDIEIQAADDEIDKDSFLYQICNNNADCSFDKIFLIVNDASFNAEIYRGLAKDYSYNWSITVDSYRLYNENDKTFIEVWCNYPYVII